MHENPFLLWPTRVVRKRERDFYFPFLFSWIFSGADEKETETEEEKITFLHGQDPQKSPVFSLYDFEYLDK